ncbi:hypothetical protein LINGRAHAP2_LOCUS20572, partial [Linum grandiflorum]
SFVVSRGRQSRLGVKASWEKLEAHLRHRRLIDPFREYEGMASSCCFEIRENR